MRYIRTNCASIGKLLSLVYICIYSANDLVPLTIKCNFFHRDYYSCVRITRGTIVMTFCTQSGECIQQELQHPCHPATSWALPALQAVQRTDNLHLRDLLAGDCNLKQWQYNNSRLPQPVAGACRCIWANSCLGPTGKQWQGTMAVFLKVPLAEGTALNHPWCDSTSEVYPSSLMLWQSMWLVH